MHLVSFVYTLTVVCNVDKFGVCWFKDLRLPFLPTVIFCILWITLWTLWIILKIH